MTDVFNMFAHFDTNNNNTAANNGGSNNFTSSNRPNMTNNDKSMIQLNNYNSIDFNNQNLYEFQDESSNCFYNNQNQYRMQTEDQSPPHKPEIIHSGHFMVSEIDKDDDADNEANVEEEVVKDEKDNSIKDEQNQVKEVVQSVTQFNKFFDPYNDSDSNRLKSNKQPRKNWNIDYPQLPSLDYLFKKMNLGNDSKFSSPKWKQFKGLKISLKAKIRVNNLIWRAWHIKYVMGKNPPINPFPPQLDTDLLETNHIYVVHRPEVMKMGKFFKISQHSQDFIALEYGKWRRYYKEIIQKQRNQLTSLNQFDYDDAFDNNQYDSSNDQYNMTIFNPINNYSSAQLGMQAEFMQPDFSYGIQPEFMDTFEEPCLQSFLTQKNSFLPTLLEEESIQEPSKISDIQTQSIYPTADNNRMNTDLNYDQQMQQVNNQLNNQMRSQQLNTLQSQTNQQQQMQQTQTVNYNFMNPFQQQQQQQTIIQNQSNSMSQMSYSRQNYLPSGNNLIVEQQQQQTNSNLNNNLNNQTASILSPNQTTNIMLPIESNQLSNANLNNGNQVNNGQFMIPKPLKPKIRSRSVSSLPQQQQIQLQRQHMIENSSSLMEINNQPMLSNQSNFHNTTSNLLSTQQHQQNNLSPQNNLPNLDHCERRTNNYLQRRSAIANQTTLMNQQQQVMQHNSNLNGQLQQSTNNSYYAMNTINQNSQQSTNDHDRILSIDYVNNNRTTMRNSINSNSNNNNQTSYYNQMQLNNATNQSIQSHGNQNLSSVLSNSNYANTLNTTKYQTSGNNELNTGTSSISQLLSTNNKLSNANISNVSNGNQSFKRNNTTTYSSFQQPQFNSSSDQFNSNANTISTSSSVNNLVISNTNVNTNLNNTNTNSPLNQSNESNNYSAVTSGANQMLRRKSNLHHQSNQTFSSFNNIVIDSSAINQKHQQQQQLINQNLLSTNNDLINQSTAKHNSSTNLDSSLENLNLIKNTLSTKSHPRIKREHHRKLSTGKLRTNSSSLTRSNSNKSINAHNPVSPTTSIQSTILNQSNINQANLNTDFINFDHTSNLLMTNNSNLNANSSTSSLQSPISNGLFTSNEYSNDSSLSLYNQTSNSPFGFQMNQNLNLNNSNGQPTGKLSIKSSSSNNSSTNSTNLSASLNSNLIKNERDPTMYREHRRVCHINAEQKRRCNIKHGFDTLRAILPSISSNNSTKISKAAMLSRGAEHIRQLRIEHEGQIKEIEALRAKIEGLNQTIGCFQNQLPATGAPISGMRPGQIKERFDNYVREKTQQNWKFWMFSIIMEPLLDSYNNTIPTTNFDELTSSVLRWLDQSCNLINLRREVLNSLRIISTSTNVLTNPLALEAESISKVIKKQSNKKK